MHKLYLTIYCLFFIWNASAQENKWQYSIGLDAFVSNLSDAEAAPDILQRKDYGGVIPYFQVGRKLNSKWTIETGLGFIRHKSSFRFEYTDIPLINSVEYLAVPVGVQYKLMNWDKISWNLGASVWNKFLLYTESNLPDITRDLIYVYPHFNTYVLNARLATGMEWTLKRECSVLVTGFVSRDITSYLNSARYLFGGIGLSYSF